VLGSFRGMANIFFHLISEGARHKRIQHTEKKLKFYCIFVRLDVLELLLCFVALICSGKIMNIRLIRLLILKIKYELNSAIDLQYKRHRFMP